ncbi:gamma carbonic anhydrase family protein [Acidobacteriota bacterium]
MVIIGPDCYIGHGAILRGDYGTIEIGEGTAVEEGAIIHARPDDFTRIGRRVTVGHGAMIHNATILDGSVIGMRATISDYSRLGEWCIIGEATLVKNGQQIPPGKIAVGVPARIIGDVSEEQRRFWNHGKDLYIDLARRYPKGLKEIDLSQALKKWNETAHADRSADRKTSKSS